MQGLSGMNFVIIGQNNVFQINATFTLRNGICKMTRVKNIAPMRKGPYGISSKTEK